MFYDIFLQVMNKVGEALFFCVVKDDDLIATVDPGIPNVIRTFLPFAILLFLDAFLNNMSHYYPFDTLYTVSIVCHSHLVIHVCLIMLTFSTSSCVRI